MRTVKEVFLHGEMVVELRVEVCAGSEKDLACVLLAYDMIRIRVRCESGRVIGTAGVIAPFIRRNGSYIKIE